MASEARPPSAAQRHFDERLRGLGFRAHPKVRDVWTKPTGERSDLMVEIEIDAAAKRMHVCLRRRGFLELRLFLAEAAGCPWYEFQDQADLERVMAEARAHFEAWGIDWLEGRPVDSPALGTRAAQEQRLRYESLVEGGRGAFKAARYAEAADTLTEAAGLLPLDEVSAKMLAIASRKRPQ
jgi:hypothetical protein